MSRSGAEIAVAVEQAGLGGREERLPDGQGPVVLSRERRQPLEVVRVADILEPAETVGSERPRGLDPRVARPGVHRIDGQARGIADDAEHDLDPADVLGERGRADLDLQHAVTAVHERSRLVLEASQIVSGVAIAARGVDGDVRLRSCLGQDLRQVTVQRQPGRLGRGIPERHVQGAHRDAALAVTARLLARHHRLPGEKRIEAAARREQPRREALADQATLRKAAE